VSEAIVHLVDDDTPFLAAMTRLLRANGYSVKAFSSAGDFLAYCDSNARGCLVVDLHMPGMNGFDLQSALAQAGNLLPVVFLTGEGDIRSAVRAMSNGAEDFLEKSAAKEALFDAVNRALSREGIENTARAELQQLRARFEALSEREREVLTHVLRGRLNKQIASDLGVNERTIKLHRTAITKKLGVRSVAEIARLAGQAGYSR
jgi:two-component system, LuxR family, response regulator FixJ